MTSPQKWSSVPNLMPQEWIQEHFEPSQAQLEEDQETIENLARKHRRMVRRNMALEYKLKQTDSLIIACNNHRIDERQSLSEEVEQLQLHLKEKDGKINKFASQFQKENVASNKAISNHEKRTQESAMKLEQSRLEYQDCHNLAKKFEYDLERALFERDKLVAVRQKASHGDSLWASSDTSIETSAFEHKNGSTGRYFTEELGLPTENAVSYGVHHSDKEDKYENVIIRCSNNPQRKEYKVASPNYSTDDLDIEDNNDHNEFETIPKSTKKTSRIPKEVIDIATCRMLSGACSYSRLVRPSKF